MYDKLTKVFLEKNKQINLSAIRDEQWVQTKHIKDSLVGLKIIENLEINRDLRDPETSSEWQNKINRNQNISSNNKISLVDVGTWSGFPLLPLAIEKSNWNFVWIESVKKKVNAVNDIITELWLQNIKVIWTRAEEYKEKQFDILTARAVAYIDKLLKFTKHLVKKWWYFVLYKLDSPEEYKDILKNCKKYNLKLIRKHPYTLFDGDVQRMIYVLQK